jgi:thiamine biosynthesis lipoprotein
MNIKNHYLALKFRKMKNILFFTCVIILISCKNEKKLEYRSYEGPIQGTMFHITYEWDKDLAPQIDSLLKQFNSSLSNYDPNSTISRINTNISDVPDELFLQMFDASKKVYEDSDGAFDISIAPIANLWGFGWVKTIEGIPTAEQIDSVVQNVGMDKISIVNGKLVKSNPNIMFISNAIAQGLSVDYISSYFLKLGIKNFLVEIGGEVYCYGLNSRQESWRIGVDKPIEDSGYENRENQIIISLSDMAIATSGNYRKFVEDGDKKLGHSLNPKTGYPAENSLLSVSVISKDCMLSDAYATAFMVCGLEKSLSILEKLENVHAYFIYLDENGKEQITYSSGFKKFIEE